MGYTRRIVREDNPEAWDKLLKDSEKTDFFGADSKYSTKLLVELMKNHPDEKKDFVLFYIDSLVRCIYSDVAEKTKKFFAECAKEDGFIEICGWEYESEPIIGALDEFIESDIEWLSVLALAYPVPTRKEDPTMEKFKSRYYEVSEYIKTDIKERAEYITRHKLLQEFGYQGSDNKEI